MFCLQLEYCFLGEKISWFSQLNWVEAFEVCAIFKSSLLFHYFFHFLKKTRFNNDQEKNIKLTPSFQIRNLISTLSENEKKYHSSCKSLIKIASPFHFHLVTSPTERYDAKCFTPRPFFCPKKTLKSALSSKESLCDMNRALTVTFYSGSHLAYLHSKSRDVKKNYGKKESEKLDAVIPGWGLEVVSCVIRSLSCKPVGIGLGAQNFCGA